MTFRSRQEGFTQNTLAKHLHCSKARLAVYVKAAGVVRRVKWRYESAPPVYHKFTKAETEAILRAAWAAKGRGHARKMGIL